MWTQKEDLWVISLNSSFKKFNIVSNYYMDGLDLNPIMIENFTTSDGPNQGILNFY